MPPLENGIQNEMMESWDLSARLTFEAPDVVRVRARVPDDSLWVHGHFPGQPILPAIALLSLAKKALQHFGDQRKMRLRSFQVRKARFTLPIRPGDAFEIFLRCRVAEEKVVCACNVLLNGKMAANAILEAQWNP